MAGADEGLIILRQMAAKFDKLEDRIERCASDVVRLDNEKANVKALAATTEEMRKHIESKNSVQTDELEKVVLLRVNGAKSDIMSDVNTLIKDALDRWMIESFVPAVKREYEQIEEARRELRNTQVMRWRNRILLATAFVGLVFSTWQAVEARNENAKLKSAYDINQSLDKAGRAIQP